ncbi:hypothetical protein SERLA73DRAFT_78648 [Serpula lacrymans var. lacrymans S7.3]|uniref:Uncharacterized protein n=2 Tax=Serpula lacrymans var. lacrymans TaxID=341189 RepID=F8QDW5_SERL3|nr:uncharacterized protein SERLADRAFT_443693 [Serpula lacrymans var. lacrymans S7.9]EGN93340.1 hypothetical protein SERLA73DRAFT_78648 [Serpula lacrymans var. lacrymans S7.3]EGO18725.1 hypothetical protein SERLADRAFT_443693 [Serpula lacrymans var. lacrymans S7.9]
MARTGEGICRHHVVKEYWEAHKGVFVTNTILQAWRKSALCPLNPGLFTAADYAPSVSTSTANYAPLSYPDTFPDGWMDGASSDDPDYAPNDAALSPDSDVSSEGAGDSDDGSDSSVSEDEGEDSNVNVGSRDTNIASGGSTDTSTSTNNSSTDVRTWLHASRGALPVEERSIAPTRSRAPSWRSTSTSFPSSRSSSRASTPGSGSRASTPGPMLVKLHPTSLLMEKSKRNLVATIHKLQVERDEARWERDTMQGHSIFMMHKFEHVKDRLKFESRARHIAEEEACKEKEWKAAEAKAKKDAKAAEHQVQMSLLDGTEVFNGALSGKAKLDLQLIATALNLSADGKKQEVLDCIKTHFQENPDLETNSRFSGLFGARTRRQALAPNGPQGITPPPPPSTSSLLSDNLSLHVNPSQAGPSLYHHSHIYASSPEPPSQMLYLPGPAFLTDHHAMPPFSPFHSSNSSYYQNSSYFIPTNFTYGHNSMSDN